MRTKVKKLVISFDSNLAAMAMEKAAKPGLGRVIPLPVSIAACCGFAYCTDVEKKDEVMEIMAANEIEYRDIHIISLYDNRR